MSTSEVALSPATMDPAILESLVVTGDCSKLTPTQRVAYYVARCDAAGLDPRAQPFQFLNLSGKLVLYALKAATDQLAAQHGIVCQVIDQRTQDGVRFVTVRAASRYGRQTDEIGAVPVGKLQGEALANAYMKALTKAKRRATLSLCGLGMLDELEVASIPRAQPVDMRDNGKGGWEMPREELAREVDEMAKAVESKQSATEAAGLYLGFAQRVVDAKTIDELNRVRDDANLVYASFTDAQRAALKVAFLSKDAELKPKEGQ